jgi:hypothetical protein
LTKPAPYPSDTKAKGWRFELDLEQVMQSDTWDIASEVPFAQPALLMIWAMAWVQTPCGSMPSDLDIVRVKCKIPRDVWPQVRDVVLRGWWLADDGRLYHDTIVARVNDMLGRKVSERQRKADYRARMDSERQAHPSSDVPHMSHGTDSGQTQDGQGKDDTGTGTGTGTINTSSLRSDVRPPRKRGSRFCPDDFEVTAEMRAWAQDEAPGVDLATQTSAFRDWEFKDAKTDWVRAWKNWIRKSVPSHAHARASPPYAQLNKQEAQEARNRAVLERAIAEDEELNGSPRQAEIVEADH